MNRRKLKKLLQTQERYEDVIKLRKNGEYEKIFELYGPEVFNIAVPGKYAREDIKKLMDLGRFEDIYRRYGAKTYKMYIANMKAQEVYYETGSKFKAKMAKFKYLLGRRIAPLALATTLVTPTVMAGTVSAMFQKDRQENAQTYAEEIKRYEDKITKYADEVRGMNLTDVQVIMKVVSDMWEEIDGYGSPIGDDPTGFYRLELSENGVGVCRNMADDVTAKLNAINPEYNARNVVVYMDDVRFNLANIERNIIEDNETVADNNEDKEEEPDKGFHITDIMGNHMITAIDIPGKNITLLVDATNPGIGVWHNGKIHMFSTEDGKGIRTKMIGQFMIDITEFIPISQDMIGSFLNNDLDLDELEEQYGPKALNEALEYLNGLNKNSFTDSLKVDVTPTPTEHTAEIDELLKTGEIQNDDYTK